jgi:ketosteroid isomerase-like protein
MKIIFLSITVSLLLVHCSPEEKKDPGSKPLTESEVRNFVNSYDAMWRRRDTASMKKAMADNYIYFTSSGSTIYRGRIISWFTPADKYIVDTAIRSEVSIHLNGNTAIVSSRWKGSGSFSGQRFRDDQRCSLVVERIKGELKVISEHCTQIAK